MIKVSYRERGGWVFRKTVTHMPSVKIPWHPATVTWRKPETLQDKVTYSWASARKNTVWSIRYKDNWWYCFANVEHKHLKKWFDYFVKKYEDRP